MAARVAYAHIAYNQHGVPYVAGTRTKVKQVVLDHIAYRWSAEDIHRNHPSLTLSQIHSALAYYYDHQQEIDESIEEGLRTVEEIRTAQGKSPLRIKLRAMVNRIEFIPI